MGRFDEYVSYLEQYQAKYGKKTIVLYQCGMFYEVYGVDNETEKIGYAADIARLLNIQLTRTDKSILNNSRKNPQMTGFPCSSIERNLQLLIEHKYTVVIVDQVGEQAVGAKKTQIREVTAVHSPATYDQASQVENYLVCCFVDRSTKNRQSLYNIGLTAIDVATGKSQAHLTISTEADVTSSLDDSYRFLQTFQPTEIIVATHNDAQLAQQIIDQFDLGQSLVHRQLLTSEQLSNTYHNQILGQIYPKHHPLDPVQYLDLEMMWATTVSLVTLLNFCLDHNADLVTKIERPTIWNNNSHLVLDNNAINQLNLISEVGRTRKTSSVLELISETSTNVGKRLLRQRLLQPATSVQEINQRLDLVELMRSAAPDSASLSLQKKDQWWFQVVEQYLREVVDLERLHRRVERGILQPCEFSKLMTSYQVISNLFETISSPKHTTIGQSALFGLLLPEEVRLKFVQYLHICRQTINLEQASQYNLQDIKGNFFKPGYSPELDRLDQQINQDGQALEQLVLGLANFSSKKDHVTLKQGEDDCYLHVTNARFKTIKANFKPFKIVWQGKECLVASLDQFTLDCRTKTATKIRGGLIDQISASLTKATQQLQQQARQVYLGFLSELIETHQETLHLVTSTIAQLDLYKAAAKASWRYKYHRPTVESGPASSFQATGLRHPLIEQLISGTAEYVPHDLSLSESGVLLYGTNAAGKSSIMKAAGIAVIMAQAGFYVAADSFKLTPYRQILTRILGNDNIFKGLSSFAVEMSELRGILNRANNQSLVLGDEICHGTETNSAIAIVAASLIKLSGIRSSFIFATHLHQLTEIDQVQALDNVHMKHLSVQSEGDGQLVYDRLLRDGPGSGMYGIEVAKAMKLPDDVVELALKLRRPEGDTTEARPSRYNSQLIMGSCALCSEPAIDSHHIKFQSEADDQGFIGHMHKNHRSNLVPLCSAHHDRVHQPMDGQELIIFGYKPDGQLDYTYRKHLASYKPSQLTSI